MSRKPMYIISSVGLVLILSLALIQGCGKMTGENYPNQSPTVQIVNVPPSAADSTETTLTAMPFKVTETETPLVILGLEGAKMVPNSEHVYRPDSTGTIVYTAGTDYDMNYDAGTLTAKSGAGMTADTSLTYYIDFTFKIDNYYVLTYAPTVHWVGYDPDGFVDHYRYADVTDPAFISAFKLSTNNPIQIYNQNKNSFTWVDTTNTSARIYLLTAQGQATEHLLFLQAVDNKGAISEGMVYKTFYRTNNAPNNPQLKPQDQPDAAFALNYVVQDTMFCLDEITPLWAGLSFNWRGDDPDDKELYKIPLQYSYYLIKTPGDTIWEWSNKEWNEQQLTTIFGLETGSYLFMVWTRDDGYAECAQPASLAFKVVRPSLQYHILVVDETSTVGANLFEIIPRTAPRDFYMNLLDDLKNELATETYQMDGVDVRLKDNSNATSVQQNPIPYSLISQYRLVFIFDDDHIEAASLYRENRNQVLADYLDIGGNVWIEGRRILRGSYGYNTGTNDITTGGTQPRILATYFQLLSGFGSEITEVIAGRQRLEFLGAIPQVTTMPELNVDTMKVHMINNPPSLADTNVLMEVDWFTRSNQAQTLFAFNSITADTSLTSQFVDNWQDSIVVAGATPTQCWIKPNPDRFLEVYHVARILSVTPTDTFRLEAEVVDFNADSILVSYTYGEPWSYTDTIEVSYKYDPISDMHLKPVAVRYEAQPRILNTIEIQGVPVTYYSYILGYRTSLYTFPLYFMCGDNDQAYQDVKAVAKEMLDWFFYPTIHWQVGS
ncbi:MAG: hypothetical protein NTW14_11100 [bacterium]|nr:hypothetical protein [bacterium]